MSSTLAIHNPKFEAKLVPFDTLAALPQPQALGPHHKPVPHARLVDAFREEIVRREYRIVREQYALGKNGAALFGVIDLTDDRQEGERTRSLALGFRNATDTSLGIRAVAGAHVFVCDNLALSGSTFAIARKNTTGLDLKDAVNLGFDKFLAQQILFEASIARQAATDITDNIAKRIIYDAFAGGIAPSRLFDDVDRFYFKPTADTPETYERTLWGLQNAFTRSFRDLTPQRRLGASVALGAHFEKEVLALAPVAVH
jgi:hypothetical protein